VLNAKLSLDAKRVLIALLRVIAARASPIRPA
jgi:hypothetical protein